MTTSLMDGHQQKKIVEILPGFSQGNENTIPNITNQLSRFRFYLNKQDRQTTTHNDEDSSRIKKNLLESAKSLFPAKK